MSSANQAANNVAIDLKDLQFAYPEAPDNQVLDVPQWSVNSGEKLFVHGPSGCGKSTLLGLISGILARTAGEIHLFGQRVDLMKNRQRDQFRANFIGYVFQQFNLIPYLSAIENIELARHFCQQNRRDQDNTLQSPSAVTNLLIDLGISTSDQQKPTAKLSIGQQQRVAIARAMINRPRLLIADEPTSSLDKKNRDAFMALLMEQSSSNHTTLVFVSHDLSLAEHFSRVEAIEAINRAARS